jgi:hypothetical protein
MFTKNIEGCVWKLHHDLYDASDIWILIAVLSGSIVEKPRKITFERIPENIIKKLNNSHDSQNRFENINIYCL